MAFIGRSGTHFDQVVKAYASELFHYAHWLTRDRHRAEDVLQEALTRAWRNWGQVKDEAARRGWMYAIVRNEFYRESRKAAAAPQQIEDDALAQIADERDFTRGLELRQILDRLPPGALEPLVLQNLAGMSCEEVAEVLGVSVGAVMTRMSRARSALRDLMRDSEGAAPDRRKESAV